MFISAPAQNKIQDSTRLTGSHLEMSDKTESDASFERTDTESEEPSHSGRSHSIILRNIHIPSASAENASQMKISAHKDSSSEETDCEDAKDEDNTTQYIRGLAPPEVLLKNYRRQAHEFAKMGDERAVCSRVRCVALTRIIFGDSHWKLAQAYSKLAQAYLEQRGLAQQAYLHAGNARDVLLMADSAKQQGRYLYDRSDVLPVMELIYLIMGQSQLALKNIQKAEHSLKKAELVSREREDLGTHNHRDPERRIKILLLLAQVSLKGHKTGFALECFEKALELAQQEYGEDSEQLISIYQGLANAERSQGDSSSHDRAMRILLQAHEISKSRFGENSVEVADSSVVVASGYMNSENGEDKAKGLLENAISLYMQLKGPYDLSTVKAQDELSRLLIRDGSLDEAASLQKSVSEAKMVVFGDPSEQAASSYQMLGSIRLKQGRMDQALKLLTKCHSMLSATLGTNHKKTKEINDVISRVKMSPNAQQYLSAEEKLKKRPRFTQVVGRSKPLGYSAHPIGD